tara:strand:- start:217 stop:459 length:243 start_codon:yes stop_codon:yes gene_type:complete
MINLVTFIPSAIASLLVIGVACEQWSGRTVRILAETKTLRFATLEADNEPTEWHVSPIAEVIPGVSPNADIETDEKGRMY